MKVFVWKALTNAGCAIAMADRALDASSQLTRSRVSSLSGMSLLIHYFHRPCRIFLHNNVVMSFDDLIHSDYYALF